MWECISLRAENHKTQVIANNLQPRGEDGFVPSPFGFRRGPFAYLVL